MDDRDNDALCSVHRRTVVFTSSLILPTSSSPKALVADEVYHAASGVPRGGGWGV